MSDPVETDTRTTTNDDAAWDRSWRWIVEQLMTDLDEPARAPRPIALKQRLYGRNTRRAG